MRYEKFIVSNYRGIIGPLEINLARRSLIPIIGINESGKTTVLHAIFSFDHHNDHFDEQVGHLKDISNLYRTSSPSAVITAVINISKSELKEALTACETENTNLKEHFSCLKKKRQLPEIINISRDLTTKLYSLSSNHFGPPEIQNILANRIVSLLPYTLYFDDFRDKIEEKIEIIAAQKNDPRGWLAFIEQLFIQTNRDFSVFMLPEMEERQRRTVLAKVERKLNETLTKEWQSFRLDDRDALTIAVEFINEATSSTVQHARAYIKLEVVEVDGNGDKHFFFISNRSKGFYWFFNFVMKLEFNPKVLEHDGSAIYLLDEPGSYLHAYAQNKLCQKLLTLSQKNRVIYCTHSHYLLDPIKIPFNNIMVADKNAHGDINLIPITQYEDPSTQNRSALQPVLDALQIKPFALDLIGKQTVVITEGVNDYFAMMLFLNRRDISILPSVGASSIKFYVPLMIVWKVDFRALWDSDEEGRKYYLDATQLFGDEIAANCLRLLPSKSSHPKRIMQNLFEGSDLVALRGALDLPLDSSFSRTLQTLFYSPKKKELLKNISEATKINFKQLFDSLSLK